jgi:hypothetical protein
MAGKRCDTTCSPDHSGRSGSTAGRANGLPADTDPAVRPRHRPQRGRQRGTVYGNRDTAAKRRRGCSWRRSNPCPDRSRQQPTTVASLTHSSRCRAAVSGGAGPAGPGWAPLARVSERRVGPTELGEHTVRSGSTSGSAYAAGDLSSTRGLYRGEHEPPRGPAARRIVDLIDARPGERNRRVVRS